MEEISLSVTSPAHPSSSAGAQHCGPALGFRGFDPATGELWISVLFIAHQDLSTSHPKLDWNDAGKEASTSGLHLDHILNFNFWRFDVKATCGQDQRIISYEVVLPREGDAPPCKFGGSFAVPSITQQWRLGAYSCNNFHNSLLRPKYGGIQPLWRDVLNVHRRSPFHMMIAHGDQLYCDHVWEERSLKKWTHICKTAERLAAPFDQTMADEALACYLKLYRAQWNEEVYREAITLIPQAMTWDDHDIFDGWGSYPPNLQNCPVFQGVYGVARRMYALFQQHCNVSNMKELNKVWGGKGWSWMSSVGPNTVVCMPDTRSERTLNQVCSDETWREVKERLMALPATTRHVVLVMPQPLLYSVRFLEGALPLVMATRAFAKMPQFVIWGTGQMFKILDEFEQPNLLDDTLDKFVARHKVEKAEIIMMLQDVARQRSLRFTFVSGDVHLGAFGQLVTLGTPEPLRKDHRYMPQVVSSGIANAPPTASAAKMLASTIKSQHIDEHTLEEMLPWFNEPSTCFTRERFLLPHRNWVVITTRPQTAGCEAEDGALEVEMRSEKFKPGVSKKHTVLCHPPLVVPPLELAWTQGLPSPKP